MTVEWLCYLLRHSTISKTIADRNNKDIIETLFEMNAIIFLVRYDLATEKRLKDQISAHLGRDNGM